MASHQCHLWRTRHPRREPTSLALRPAQAGGGHRGYVDLKTRHRRRDLLASALVCADASRSIQPGLHRCPVGSRWVASPHAADQVRCRFGPNGCSQQDKTSASPNRSVRHRPRARHPLISRPRWNSSALADSAARPTPTGFAEFDVPHRPVNTRPLGRPRQRRACDSTLGRGQWLSGWVDDHRVAAAFR
jgi:hypothetical protein